MLNGFFGDIAARQKLKRGECMNKRRQYLINRKFQLRYTFSILGFIFAVMAIIIGLIGINAACNNGKMTEITGKNGDIIKKIEANMISHDNILGATLIWVQNPKVMPSKEIPKEIIRTHYRELQATKANLNVIKENTDTIQNIIDLNTTLIIAIVLIVIIQGILFYVMMIRKTHKIAGPAHIMTEYFREIAEGKNPEIRALRAGDELQELFDAFTKMAARLKGK